jgi:hypothetical protein
MIYYNSKYVYSIIIILFISVYFLIEIGKTKAINIEFSILYPSTPYFIDIDMLIEFTIQGQAISTRFDIVPYILSPFSTHIKYPT